MDETASVSTLNDFELLKQVGKGSFGIVYQVKRKKDNLVYALKCINISKMDKKGIESSLNEIRILCSITHPNIVGYKDAFLDKKDTELNIVMEYVGGGDLSSKISQCAKRKLFINEDTIWKYFCQTLIGLRALHGMKIIHRDIKSANLFLSEDYETVKLGDLNVAKIAKNDLASTQIGTPYYLAPEIWKNQVYSYKCDIFSLGCVAYEMAALKMPFEGGSLQDLFKRITRGIISPISKVYSEDLYSVIKLCLTVDPLQRPSADQLIAHPVIAKHLLSLNINLQNDQKYLDRLMSTIKVDQLYNNKIKIALPNSKRYRAKSVEALNPNLNNDIQNSKPVSHKLPESNRDISNKIIYPPTIEEQSDMRKKIAEQDRQLENKPTVKLPPIKTSKQIPPHPIGIKVPFASPGQYAYGQRDNLQNRNPEPISQPKARESSRSKASDGNYQYQDYIQKLAEQNNIYLKEKQMNENLERQSRGRISSAEPRQDQRDHNYKYNYHRANPLW
jgi:NIMA (never in mitosis gene a)-related kinase